MRFTNKALTLIKTRLHRNLASVKAFTLIELLIVIVIIGILISIPLLSFATQLKKARDTQRKSDLKEYQTALVGYSTKHKGLYPSYTDVTDLSGASLCGTDLGLSVCPDDPLKVNSYKYISNGDGTGGPNATKYVTWAKVENNPNYFWVACSNGTSGYTTTEPTDFNCPALIASITASSSTSPTTPPTIPPTTPPTIPPTIPPTAPPTATPSLTPVPTPGKLTFDYTGSTQTFTVPPGVTLLRVKVWGAGGATVWGSSSYKGGSGGYSTSSINVTPGESLTILVGGTGVSPHTYTGGSGGFGGGGRGGDGSSGGGGAGGGGGGRSEIARGNTSLIVAGGGGGATLVAALPVEAGKGGGTTGMDGIPSPLFPNTAGKGGSQLAGGAGGTEGTNGGSGSKNTGGDGASAYYGGGGGGGSGYYGGGGGAGRTSYLIDQFANRGPGGGGSGYVPAGGTTIQGVGSDPDRGNAGDMSHNGRVVIYY